MAGPGDMGDPRGRRAPRKPAATVSGRPLAELLDNARVVLDALYDGVVVVDAAGIIVYVNEAHERITGIKREAAVGRYVGDVVPETSLSRVVAEGEPLVGVRTKVGEHEVISNIVPIVENGRPVGGVSVFRDITEVEALSARLAAAEHRVAHLASELRAAVGGPGDYGDARVVVGKNPRVREVFRLAAKAAQVTSTVLIQGESGVGKEVLARFIHESGPRQEKLFLTVNCAAIPDPLLESELFGYEEGAFTGARRGGKPGLFELADGGTVFLDEVGDMSLPLQAKVLRFLQDRSFKRVGGIEDRRADVRIIAATNKDLDRLVEEGGFRADLFYRLNVIPALLPPLRKRREDLPALTEALLERLGRRMGRPKPELSPEAWRVLLSYYFPGNIRELENTLEHALALADGPVVRAEDLPREVRARAGVFWQPGETRDRDGVDAPRATSLRQKLEAVDPRDGRPTRLVSTDDVREAVARIGSKAEAARSLGISRATVYRRLGGGARLTSRSTANPTSAP